MVRLGWPQAGTRAVIKPQNPLVGCLLGTSNPSHRQFLLASSDAEYSETVEPFDRPSVQKPGISIGVESPPGGVI